MEPKILCFLTFASFASFCSNSIFLSGVNYRVKKSEIE